ncbi:signal recognition particle 14 kDa protein isoform X2 [Quercus suber]|uniref:signal recognition particle 14 kDa protein isoform X2 n=1 Tax=Quercus suber TaxID=58331 RepID=UPI000CE21157|nr:signal recognition particle 14 kDa protein-like isoform X2 [Quercus suber]
MNSPACLSTALRRALFGLLLNDVSSLKSKVQKNKMTTAGDAIEYRCLIRATDGKKTISTSVGAKDHQRFQASYATILKAHMTALKKRERKDKKKGAEGDKKEGGVKKTNRV